MVFAGAIAMAVFDAVWLAGKRGVRMGSDLPSAAKRGTIQLRLERPAVLGSLVAVLFPTELSEKSDDQLPTTTRSSCE